MGSADARGISSKAQDAVVDVEGAKEKSGLAALGCPRTSTATMLRYLAASGRSKIRERVESLLEEAKKARSCTHQRLQQ